MAWKICKLFLTILHFSCDLHSGFAAIPVAFPGFGIPNGIGGVPNFGLPGNMGNFPGYGNPASFPNFNNQPNFGGLQQPPMPVKESVVPTVSGSNIHQVLSSIGNFLFNSICSTFVVFIQSKFSYK